MTLQDVITIIRSISGHPSNKCYYHLALVVYHCCQIPIYQGFCLEKQIYPVISSEIGLSTVSISRSVARAAHDCWDYGDRKKLEHIAGRRLVTKPSPKELVCYLCEFLNGGIIMAQ
ncbi:MAG: sporulation initiation factor Spo0A C-terminal domain-containing protein [Eubacteriales bacterium]|nr:sporulation initiation factor Spo0A C-terminal domain-containing protein [Eubacteriales bacterium]